MTSTLPRIQGLGHRPGTGYAMDKHACAYGIIIYIPEFGGLVWTTECEQKESENKYLSDSYLCLKIPLSTRVLKSHQSSSDLS
jgi:hypothetical protein